MKTDINGCSITKPGEEHWEEYFSKLAQGIRVQYDYRTPDGELFSCIAKTLGAARQKRDQWLEKREDEELRQRNEWVL